MSEESDALALLRRQLRLVTMMAWTSGVVGSSFVVEPFTRVDRRQSMIDRHKMRWAYGALGIVGLEVQIVEGSPPPPERGRLVVANHRTPLDALALLSHFGGHFVANHKTRTAPVVGAGARRIGTIFVDRDDRRSGATAIRTMKRMLEEKRTVIVFPEGTTYGGDEVQPFKPGALLAARGLDVDIVPVGLAYTPGHEFATGSLGSHVRGFLGRRRTPTWMAIGESVRLAPGMRPDAALAEDLRARVQSLVSRARREAPPILADVAGETTSEAPREGATR